MPGTTQIVAVPLARADRGEARISMGLRSDSRSKIRRGAAVRPEPRAALARRPAVRVVAVARFPVCRQGLRTMLDAPGIRVLGVAESADRAARLLARRKPHVLLIWSCAAAEDAALDAITGAKATSSRTSVILVMPSLGAFDVTRALKLGCSGYLQPTVGRGALRRAVRAVARGECIVEPSALKDLLNALARTRDRAQPEGQDSLAASEREMLRLITEGMTNRDIAAKLGYRLGTVKEYVQRIIEKLGVSDRTQAAAKAVRLGLVE